jgi:hypothetical protein
LFTDRINWFMFSTVCFDFWFEDLVLHLNISDWTVNQH